MADQGIKDLVDRYIDLSFSVKKRASSLIQEQIGSDLTEDQLYILRYIYRAGTCTSTQLAEYFDVQKSAITAITTRMWDKGFIARKRDNKDRRVIYISLTEKGKDLYLLTEKRVHSLVETLIKKFDQEEITRFIETYEKINRVLFDLRDLQVGESS